jgi:hypothetical protein
MKNTKNFLGKVKLVGANRFPAKQKKDWPCENYDSFNPGLFVFKCGIELTTDKFSFFSGRFEGMVSAVALASNLQKDGQVTD